MDIALIELQLLLNTDKKFYPVEEGVKIPEVIIKDSSVIANNPMLAVLQQQKQSALSQTALEKAKLSPDILLAYSNNSFTGTGADNKVYSSAHRFNAVQLGIGIPIFAGSQKARVKASKLAEIVAESQYQLQRQSMEVQQKKLLASYQSNAAVVKYFEETGLKNADLILKTANRQFSNGEINYLDFVLLANQAIAVQSNYADAVWALNENIIQLKYITTK